MKKISKGLSPQQALKLYSICTRWLHDKHPKEFKALKDAIITIDTNKNKIRKKRIRKPLIEDVRKINYGID